MSKSKYQTEEKIKIVKECIEWCMIPGNSVASFSRFKDIDRTSLYNWKKRYSNYFNTQNILPMPKEICSTKNNSNQLSKFVKVENSVKLLPVSIEPKEEATLTIKTQYCSIEIPNGTSKASIKNLLESLREIS